ncbi:MAG TPA: transglutaminase domain-containing protein [Patescibacteria group bacterium]|nr:transglutaminase domain-containing protein [Patescibacteria group bacterium]
MPKAVSFLLAFFLFLSIFPTFSPHGRTQAAGEFKTDYTAAYVAAGDGTLEVSQNVTIENLTSQYFVSQYKFTIGSESPKNVTAWDSTGSLNPVVKKSGGKTVVTLNFRARVYGKGNKLNFGIAYDFPGLVNRNGLIWEINLLKITGLKDISSYNLTVSVPVSFGSPIFQFPSPSSQKVSNQRRQISYNKSALLQGAPRMGFGDFQLYQLTLTYHLKNTRVGFGYTEIALPPDLMGYQEIVQNSLLPAPVSIRVDADGNYLARYNLRPLEKKDVVWEGWLALYYPDRKFGTDKLSSLPVELVSKYTGSQKYWETSTVEIKAEAAKLTDPKNSVAGISRQIYSFVTGKLSYDYKKLEGGELVRLGALAALAQPDKAVCMEYTDLFVAVARAAGIPAREVNGFAYTADDTNRPLSLRVEGDVLHAWPQVYIPGPGWTMIDPTWGSTSGSDYFSAFDLSHLAFVVKGESSEYPLPAGSYKTDPNQKDVAVAFSTEKEVVEESPRIEVEMELPWFILSPLGSSAKITVTNTGKTSAFAAQAEIESSLLGLENPNLEIGTLPPGASSSYTVALTSPGLGTKGEEQLRVRVSAQDFQEKEVSAEEEVSELVRPLYWPLRLPELAVLAGFGLLIFFGRRASLAHINKP